MAEETRSKLDQLVEYTVAGNKVQLTPNTVRNYLVSGNKDQVTIQEVVVFMNLCRFSGLNPWVREAYLIKYGSEPATMVVGKEAFLKRAEANKNYDGMESGIIILKNNGEVVYRTGILTLPDETIVGGWAEVFRKDRSHSTRIEVAFDEYAGRKKDGTLNQQWSKKPGTMIRKVAQVQALRETFPSEFGGMYAAEEQGLAEPDFVQPVIEQPQVIEEKKPETDPIAARLEEKHVQEAVVEAAVEKEEEPEEFEL